MGRNFRIVEEHPDFILSLRVVSGTVSFFWPLASRLAYITTKTVFGGDADMKEEEVTNDQKEKSDDRASNAKEQ